VKWDSDVAPDLFDSTVRGQCGTVRGPHINVWTSTCRDVRRGLASNRTSTSRMHGRTLMLRSVRELRELSESRFRAVASSSTSESLKVTAETS